MSGVKETRISRAFIAEGVANTGTPCKMWNVESYQMGHAKAVDCFKADGKWANAHTGIAKMVLRDIIPNGVTIRIRKDNLEHFSPANL